jgi:mannosyltransferase
VRAGRGLKLPQCAASVNAVLTADGLGWGSEIGRFLGCRHFMDVSTTAPRTGQTASGRTDVQARSLTLVRWQVVVLLTLAAALLRLHGIGQGPFWKNELFSLYWSRHSLAFLLTRGLFVETNPPLHFVLLKFWILLFGNSEFAVRSLSALASIGSVPLIYLLGRELGGPRVGLLAALLLAVCPVQVFLAQEARVYAFIPLFVMAAMLGLCRFLKASADAASGGADRHVASRGLMLYAAAGVLLLYSHAIAAFLLLAFVLSGLRRLRAMRARRGQVLAFLGANAAAGLLGLPVLVAMATQTFSPNLDWIAPLSLHTPLVISHYLMVGPMVRGDLGPAAGAALLFTELAVGVVLSLILVVFSGRAMPEPGARAAVLLFPLLFLLVVCAVSIVRPILEPRVVAWMSVPISLAMAFLLTAPQTKALRPFIATLLACATVIGLCNNLVWPAQPYPDWRGFVHDVDPAAAAAPMLVAGPHAGPLGVAFYTDGPVRTPLRQWTLTPGSPLSNADRMGQDVAGAMPITTDALVAKIRSGGHLRLFLDANDQATLGRELAALPDFAAARRQEYPGLWVYSW